MPAAQAVPPRCCNHRDMILLPPRGPAGLGAGRTPVLGRGAHGGWPHAYSDAKKAGDRVAGRGSPAKKRAFADRSRPQPSRTATRRRWCGKIPG